MLDDERLVLVALVVGGVSAIDDVSFRLMIKHALDDLAVDTAFV